MFEIVEFKIISSYIKFQTIQCSGDYEIIILIFIPLTYHIKNKKIDRIACGSAHTLAWSTCESGGHSLPLQVPIEYNHLQELPISTIRNRALLLHSFSKLFCSCIPLMDLIEDCEVSCGSEKMINSLKGVLLCSFKVKHVSEILFCMVIQHRTTLKLNEYSTFILCIF